MSVEHKKYEMSFDDVIGKPYSDVIMAIYDSIPSHYITEITKDEVKYLFGYYPMLYSALSTHWSLLLEMYESRVDGKVKDLKNAYDQALKVVKFQYEALSRKITVDKDEEGIWGTSARK